MNGRRNGPSGAGVSVPVAIVAAMFAVLTALPAPACGKEYEYAGEYEIGDTLRIGVFGGLSKYYFWEAMWRAPERACAAAGGLQFRRYALPQGEEEVARDWVVCHISVAESSSVTLGNGVSFLFVMPDSAEEVCEEVVFVDSPLEWSMVTTVRGQVELNDKTELYRAKNGAFVAFLGFPEGSMKIDHGGDCHGPVDMAMPVDVRLVGR